MDKEDKEDLLKYFNEWNGITPGAYEGLLRENCGLLYNHHNIRQLMVTAERFLYLFNDLWTTLSRLEYIGKHKETSLSPNAPDNRKNRASHAGTYWTNPL